MAYTYDQAISELASRSTLAELIDLVRNTDAHVVGAPGNATTVLYSGSINGESAINIAKSISQSTSGEAGAGRFVIVDDTEVGKLLFDRNFTRKLNEAIQTHLEATLP